MGAVRFIFWVFNGCILVLGMSQFASAVVAPECNPSTPATATNANCLGPKMGCFDKSSPFVPPSDPILRDHIVSKHNIRRSLIALGAETRGNQPATPCMAQLTWDPELERSAQNWADQCTLSGAPSRNKLTTQNPGGQYVGQNAYAFVDPPGTIPEPYAQLGYFDKAFDSWYGEVSKFNGAKAGTPFAVSPGTGHYTQIAWGASTKIGCGWRRWELRDGTTRYVWLVICHYWPGGNLVGVSPVYSTQNVPQCTGCTSALNPNFAILEGSTPSGSLCAIPNSSGLTPAPPTTTPSSTLTTTTPSSTLTTTTPSSTLTTTTPSSTLTTTTPTQGQG